MLMHVSVSLYRIEGLISGRLSEAWRLGRLEEDVGYVNAHFGTPT